MTKSILPLWLMRTFLLLLANGQPDPICVRQCNITHLLDYALSNIPIPIDMNAPTSIDI